VQTLLRRSLAFQAFLVGIAVGAVVCVPDRAAAEVSRITVHWSGPEGCPGEAAVRRRVLELAAPGAGLDADVVVTEAEGRFRAALHVRTGPSLGERFLDETSCERLAESAAVILAMSGTPLETVALSPPPPSPRARVAPAAPPVAPPQTIVRIRAHASVDVGTLPAPTLGGGIAVAFTPGDRIAIGLAGTIWVEQTATVASLANQGARFSLLTGDATGCYGFHGSTFEVSPCAVLELAHLTATGVGESQKLSPTATWLAVGVGAAVRWEVARHFALVAELDGLVPTQGQSFVLEPHGTVHTIGPVAGRGYFGPEVRF
jgi:hypothetical protein